MRVHLQADKIVETARILQARIEDRFPNSGLAKLSADLWNVAYASRQRSNRISRPIWSIRVTVGLLIALIVAGIIAGFWTVELSLGDRRLGQIVSILEAGINDAVLVGAAIFFLVTLETRMKRRRALQALHELRSLAHIIDMHQLTKDPERTLGLATHPTTIHSPKRRMTPFELGRYFDYCSEMLALVSKIAGVYAHHFEDGVALAAVDQVEALSTGLSRKIWQKIMILNTVHASRAAAAEATNATNATDAPGKSSEMNEIENLGDRLSDPDGYAAQPPG